MPEVTVGQMQAELMLQLPGAAEPVIIGTVHIPLVAQTYAQKSDGLDHVLQLGIDIDGFRAGVTQMFAAFKTGTEQ